MPRNCTFIAGKADKDSGLAVFVCAACGFKVRAAIDASLRRTCPSLHHYAERVGHHLSILLGSFSIKPINGCKCKSRSKYLDALGADWCEQNIETIVEWLKEEAAARGLPFISTVGRMLVRRAISTARREAERAKDTT